VSTVGVDSLLSPIKDNIYVIYYGSFKQRCPPFPGLTKNFFKNLEGIDNPQKLCYAVLNLGLD